MEPYGYECMHEDPRDYFEPFLEFADGLSDQSALQDIESIVLELEKLLSDALDTMPRLRPVLESLLSEHRHATYLDTSRV